MQAFYDHGPDDGALSLVRTVDGGSTLVLQDFDVVVVGGGNAGLCAALSAIEKSKRVLLVERAPESSRGGNSKYTRDIRCCQAADAFTTGSYDEGEFFDDLLQVTHGSTNVELAKYLIRESRGIPKWMEGHGVRWQKALSGTLHLSRTNRFFLGGGKALVNAYYESARKKGVNVAYDAMVEDLAITERRFEELTVNVGGVRSKVRARSVVIASGGFEANVEWLKKYWGAAAENFVIRGCKFNDGAMLRALIGSGLMTTGDPKQLHAIAVDARSPKYDGGIVTRIDSLPFGIVVNKLGRRFYDEGEDLWPKRYAIWGKLIAEQPGQIAFSVFDSRVAGAFLPTVYEPFQSETIAGLAEGVGIDAQGLTRTLEDYNGCLSGDSPFNPAVLDGCGTRGVEPPKSHWAQRIDRPPFFAYPLRPGITFTYLGVKSDLTARTLFTDGRPSENVFVAGEIMAGNILTQGYLAGLGLTIGTVFGRTAGKSASELV